MSYLLPMSGLPVPTDPPEPGRAQPPIYPLQIGGHGGWREVRATPADGSCGVHGYPCEHPGIDVAGAAGTPVVAPESGMVVMAGDGASPPFVGYGPWFIVVLGQNSGRYHLLGHLDPVNAGMVPMGAQVVAGDPIGTTSSANHTHWEVRTQMTPPAGQTNVDNNMDPVAWLEMEGATSVLFWALIAGGVAAIWWLLIDRR